MLLQTPAIGRATNSAITTSRARQGRLLGTEEQSRPRPPEEEFAEENGGRVDEDDLAEQPPSGRLH